MDEMSPEQWAAEELVEGQGQVLPLWRAVGSFHVWLIARRVHQGLPPSVTVADRQDGKRWLRAAGWKTRRVDGATCFVGIGPRQPPAAEQTGELDVLTALASLADMVHPADLDAGYLDLTGQAGRPCARCGRPTRHPVRHYRCKEHHADA
jgi:hypothetical protein